MSQVKQNQTIRQYEEVNDFELRTGRFVNPNEYFDGIKFEIRILHKDPEIIQALKEKIMEWIK